MNIKIVEYSIFVLSVTVIYLIVVCRDLQHTNELQDTALGELTRSIPLLVRTNIDSYHRNNHDQIKTENENLNSESVYKKGDDIMKEDLVKKSMNVNTGVPRKAFHNNYDKHRYGRDVSMYPSYDYRKSFDATQHRIKNNNKETMKKMWTKKRSFRNKRREAMKSKEPVKDNNWNVEDTQEKDTIEREPNWKEELLKMNANRENTNTQVNEDLELLSLGRKSRRLNSNSYEGNHHIGAKVTSETALDRSNSGMVDDDDYNNDVASDNITNNFVFGIAEDILQSLQNFVCTMGEIVPYGDTFFYGCGGETDEDGNSTINTDDNEDINTTSTDATTNTDDVSNSNVIVDDDNYANMASDDDKNVIDMDDDDSAVFEEIQNDSNILSPVSENDDSSSNGLIDNVYNDDYNISDTTYINDDMISTENDGNNNDMVDDDDYNNINDSVIADNFGYDNYNISTNATYSIDDKVLSSGMTDDYDYYFYNKTPESSTNENTEQPTHYPLPEWQCKNEICLCDSNPSLTSHTLENLTFMLDVSMFSDSDKLQDVESAQYKAACWVLYDDPYEHYDLVDDGAHNRMIQRYILAVFYFGTSPKEWKEHFDFLSSRSECDWNYFDDDYSSGGTFGISCDEDDNVIGINLAENNLGGTIVGELSVLRMLEVLSTKSNKIQGTIPSVLGRLSELRVLDLRGNDLEGTIPPQLFNATNLEGLDLQGNRLEGTIPETIGNLQKLSGLFSGWNNLSGSIPDALYSLKHLELLYLYGNKLSSSISTLIGNLNKLKELYLNYNMLTGQIPSTIGSLSSLRELDLSDNRLSGPISSTIGNMTSLNRLYLNNNTLSEPIPESLYDLPHIWYLYLQDNSVIGSVPDEFCERVEVFSDCRNDVFDPEVSCSCCICRDETPIWDGDCADSYIKVVIDHDSGISLSLEWSLTKDATGKKVLHDGPYRFEEGLETYKACMAYSDCLSFNQISPPFLEDINVYIYWNDESIHNGTFLGLGWYDYDYDYDYPRRTLLSFSYDEENQQLASCYEIKLECYKEEQHLLLEPNTTKRIMYDQAIKISGKANIHDISSPQSQALCWMLNDNHYDNKSDISDTDIIQRYVLAILHFMSQDGLFGDYDYEYPPVTHECDWNGITCRDNNTKNVTGISLSSENNQIINGILIEEIGSLKYLEVLELNQTQLKGTIPRSFSNLWSLTKLDLSGNEINSTIPATLFQQLTKLEYIDLSNNTLSGSINSDIGSYSNIRTLLLRNNSLTGSLPLDSFKYYDLEYLDIGENELSWLDLLLLLEHTNLKSLDISSNFFVGSLPDHTFTSLSQLRYFNASKNDISGIIPSTFPELSNITHIDLHINKLRGSIPSGITELRNIQLLNLQGNKLTGSLSSELNQLKNLDILVLSHNEFKGSIPFNQSNLHKMKRLHLHSNKLEGVAPEFKNIKSYITDCGFPSDSLDPVRCSTCNTCCNSDGGCQSKTPEKLSEVYKTLIFMFSIIGIIITCYALKEKITSSKYLKSFFEEKVKSWNALMLISDKSVYHFLLIDNKTEWYTAVMCGIFQTATLFLFVRSADMVNDTSDREYFMLCPANSLECDDLNRVSPYGIFIFGLILTIWLLRDIIGSAKLMLVSFEKRNIDFFFTSAVVFSVTMLSLWTSIIYIKAIAGKNTDMIKDAVVLLFVVEIDERIFQLVESVNPDWVHAINRNMRNSLVYEGKNLIISSWMNKASESFASMK